MSRRLEYTTTLTRVSIDLKKIGYEEPPELDENKDDKMEVVPQETPTPIEILKAAIVPPVLLPKIFKEVEEPESPKVSVKIVINTNGSPNKQTSIKKKAISKEPRINDIDKRRTSKK